MALLSDDNRNVGFVAQAFLSVICLLLVYKFVKYLIDRATRLSLNHSYLGRRLGLGEEILDIFSIEKRGMANICVAISLTSKQSLAHQHVHDALVLLAKRQPMLRAVIKTMENKDKYFEIKEMNEITTMIDLTTSDIKASDWKEVWFEYTAKHRENGLLWRVVVLEEEFIPDTKEYVNTLMFNFSHACIDGVSSVKFCKQFLNNLNEVATGIICVDKEVCSFDVLPYVHDIVIRERILHSIFNFILAHCGLRWILKFCLNKLISHSLQKKQCNPFYAQFPANVDITNFVIPSRLSVKVFSVDETMKIIQACRGKNCTITGALAAAHLAFCQILKDFTTKDVKLEYQFPIDGQRHCDPKPHEDYLGFFAYQVQEFYIEYMTGANADFWKLAQETTRRIQDSVTKEAYIFQGTVIIGAMGRGDVLNFMNNKMLFRKSICNHISSLGNFNFGSKEQQAETYKLHGCFINTLVHGINGTFSHFNNTINDKMTWQIASNVTVDASHAEKFVNLCFGKFIEICDAV